MWPRLCKILIIALSVVVLPVPGPPVSTVIPQVSAVVIACFCKSAYSISSSLSQTEIASSSCVILSAGKPKSSLILEALLSSVSYIFGVNINSLPSMLSLIKLRSNTILSRISSSGSASIFKNPEVV